MFQHDINYDAMMYVIPQSSWLQKNFEVGKDGNYYAEQFLRDLLAESEVQQRARFESMMKQRHMILLNHPHTVVPDLTMKYAARYVLRWDPGGEKLLNDGDDRDAITKEPERNAKGANEESP